MLWFRFDNIQPLLSTSTSHSWYSHWELIYQILFYSLCLNSKLSLVLLKSEIVTDRINTSSHVAACVVMSSITSKCMTKSCT